MPILLWNPWPRIPNLSRGQSPKWRGQQNYQGRCGVSRPYGQDSLHFQRCYGARQWITYEASDNLVAQLLFTAPEPFQIVE
jgi:hypothetical protein